MVLEVCDHEYQLLRMDNGLPCRGPGQNFLPLKKKRPQDPLMILKGDLNGANM